jgi:hypothetical protein
MAVIPFAEFAPDNAVYDAQVTGFGRNALPAKVGFVPAKGTVAADLVALDDPCLGFVDFEYEGLRRVIAGTSDNIYEYNFAAVPGSEWVSVKGSVTISLSDGARWRFDRRGDWLRACNGSNKLMRFDLTDGTSPVFVEATDSPAGLIAVASYYDLTVGVYNDGDQGYAAWSDTDDDTTWIDSGSPGNAGEQPIPGGGPVTAQAVGETWLVFQKTKLHRLQYTGDVTSLISRVEIDSGRGCLGPNAVCVAGNTVFFVSVDGFYRGSWAGEVVPIGAERVNEFWLARCANLDRPLTFIKEDPLTERVSFHYATGTLVGYSYDEALIYDYSLDKWSPPVDWPAQAIGDAITPGVSLEDIGASHGSLEDYNMPLDSRANQSSDGLIGVFTDLGVYGTREGANLEAQLETAPFLGPDGRRMLIKGLFPVVDAEHWTAQLGTQERMSDEFVFSPANAPEPVTGMAGFQTSGRSGKVRITIPAAETWTRAEKVDVQLRVEGRR